MFLVCIKVDIFFLIDDFSSVLYLGFMYVKSVVVKLVDCFMIGFDDVRVGMMMFGLIILIWFIFS